MFKKGDVWSPGTMIVLVAIVAIVGMVILSLSNVTGQATKSSPSEDKWGIIKQGWAVIEEKWAAIEESWAAIEERDNNRGEVITTEVITHTESDCLEGEWCVKELAFSNSYTEIPLCEVFSLQKMGNSYVWEQQYQCILKEDLSGVLAEAQKGMTIKVLVHGK